MMIQPKSLQRNDEKDEEGSDSEPLGYSYSRSILSISADVKFPSASSRTFPV